MMMAGPWLGATFGIGAAVAVAGGAAEVIATVKL